MPKSDASEPPPRTAATAVTLNAPSQRPLLAEPSFLVLWLVGALVGAARWLELLVVGIYVFDETGSPLLVASMLMLRMLPLALFGAFAGVIAARFDRRRILLGGLALLALLAGGMGWLGSTGRLEVWHVAVAAFLAGTVWAMDFPVRRTLIGEIAGPARTGAAMSLDTMASSGTKMAGPIAGGALYAAVGMEGAFFLTAATYAIACVVLASTRPSVPGRLTNVASGVFSGVREGLAGLKDSPTLVGVLAVTIVFNVWGFPILSMVPVIGKDVLGLTPFEVGLIASMEGLGSLPAAICLALFGRTLQFRRLYMGGVGLYLVFALGFALSTNTILTGLLLLGLGVGLASFAAMQSALVLLNAPERLRRQMMGVLSVCIGMGPLGFAHLGLMAAWLGATTACLGSGARRLGRVRPGDPALARIAGRAA